MIEHLQMALDITNDLITNSSTPLPTQEPAPSSDGGAKSTFDYISPFIDIGLVGLFFLMFIFRKGVVPEWVLRQAEERHTKEIEGKDEDIAELKRMVGDMTKLYNDQVVPAFTRSIDVNREYLEVLRDGEARPTRTRRRPPAGD